MNSVFECVVAERMAVVKSLEHVIVVWSSACSFPWNAKQTAINGLSCDWRACSVFQGTVRTSVTVFGVASLHQNITSIKFWLISPGRYGCVEYMKEQNWCCQRLKKWDHCFICSWVLSCPVLPVLQPSRFLSQVEAFSQLVRQETQLGRLSLT